MATADVPTDRGLQSTTDEEAFDRRYTDEHIPLVKAVPGLGSLQLSHPQGGTPYLVAELFFRPSEDAFKASAATPEIARPASTPRAASTTFTVYTGERRGLPTALQETLINPACCAPWMSVPLTPSVAEMTRRIVVGMSGATGIAYAAAALELARRPGVGRT